MALSEVNFGRLGYGAANLGNLYRAISEDLAWAVLDAAWDVGIRYFDTAPHYGLGLSERRVGAFLQTKPRDQFVISTKVGRLLRPNPGHVGDMDLANNFVVPADWIRVWDLSEVGVRTSLEESLERLGLDHVDVLFLHDPERHDLERGLAEAIPALVALREAHLVKAIGVGSMTTDALLTSAETGLLDLLMVAGRYTLADQPVFPDVIGVCQRNSVGIVNASIFNSGLLAKDVATSCSRYDYGEVPAALLRKVQTIASTCAEFGVALPSAALQYTLRDPVVRTVIIGSSSPTQVRQNAARMADAIPDELWQRLRAEELIPA